ncbi:hypothetical protein JW935_15180 [candidate division KSB1 bacterium]|nr:hypothetical protein [candidate division KSB1 bacterium]
MIIRKFNPAFITFLFLISALSFQCVHENDHPEESDLNQAMLGAWVRLPDPKLEDQPTFESYYKFWDLRHWCISNSDPETGHIIFHHGGTFTIDGDIFNQVGIDNAYTQQWRRLKSQ